MAIYLLLLPRYPLASYIILKKRLLLPFSIEVNCGTKCIVLSDSVRNWELIDKMQISMKQLQKQEHSFTAITKQMLESIILPTIITYIHRLLLSFQLSFISASQLPCEMTREGMIIQLKHGNLKLREATLACLKSQQQASGRFGLPTTIPGIIPSYQRFYLTGGLHF